MSINKFPHILRVEIASGDGVPEEVADYWRHEGYRVRILRRVVRALGAAVEVQVVVLVGRK